MSTTTNFIRHCHLQSRTHLYISAIHSFMALSYFKYEIIVSLPYLVEQELRRNIPSRQLRSLSGERMREGERARRGRVFGRASSQA